MTYDDLLHEFLRKAFLSFSNCNKVSSVSSSSVYISFSSFLFYHFLNLTFRFYIAVSYNHLVISNHQDHPLSIGFCLKLFIPCITTLPWTQLLKLFQAYSFMSQRYFVLGFYHEAPSTFNPLCLHSTLCPSCDVFKLWKCVVAGIIWGRFPVNLRCLQILREYTITFLFSNLPWKNLLNSLKN